MFSHIIGSKHRVSTLLPFPFQFSSVRRRLHIIEVVTETVRVNVDGNTYILLYFSTSIVFKLRKGQMIA